MHPDEVRTDAHLVRRLIEGQFPRWSGLPIEPIAPAGTDNALYRLGSDWVARLPKIAWAVPELELRAEWLPRLAPGLSHPVAMPFVIGEPAHGYPWRWSVYRWLDGRNPVAGDVDQPESLAADLAEFVLSLRSLDSTGGPRAGFCRDAPLRQRDEPTRAAIANLAAEIETDAVTAAWDASLAVPDSTSPEVWLHADLAPGNILTIEGRLSGVLDFTPGVGLPDCELIVAWNLLPPAGRAVLRSALDVDNEAWTRGRGWALTIALLQLDYYRDTNPSLAANARHVIGAVIADA